MSGIGPEFTGGYSGGAENECLYWNVAQTMSNPVNTMAVRVVMGSIVDRGQREGGATLGCRVPGCYARLVFQHALLWPDPDKICLKDIPLILPVHMREDI